MESIFSFIQTSSKKTSVNPKTILTLAAATLAAASAPILVHADPLDPLAFASEGVPTFSTGTYNVETSSDLGAPTITDGSGNVIATGTFSGTGTSAVAVFDFTSIDIPTGVTLAGVNDADSHPFAILSQSGFTLEGNITANGNAGSGTRGGDAGPGGGGGGGGFGYGNAGGGNGLYAGGAGDFYTGQGHGGAGGGPGGAGAAPAGSNGAGGGFGGAGGSDFSGQAPAGSTYGNLRLTLQGGSGGGGGSNRSGTTARGGGGGGGGIELCAVAHLTISGAVNANGGGAGQDGAYGGNGSGGGILIHAGEVILDGNGIQLQADGGQLTGATGGGGRIAIGTVLGTGAIGTNAATGIDVSGTSGLNPGTVDSFTYIPVDVPEPSTWAMMFGGLAGLAIFQAKRRRAARA